MAGPRDVIDFWLEEVGEKGWYAGGEALDALCRERWLGLWEEARAGALGPWRDGPEGALAFLILTDQFPRNMHRGDALAFATDPSARTAAREAVAKGWDMAVEEPARQFFYLPFEHSEALADQDWAVALIAARIAAPSQLIHARAHREVIARFGRFPFRNDALGRDTTEEEAAFLAEGGYGAVVRSLGG